MSLNKRSKDSRQRGSHTHGWGAKKKHRGKGNKGGAGMAGTGKRGDQKKPVIWKNTKYFGRYGFEFKGVKQQPAITIRALCSDLPALVAKGTATESKGAYAIDLAAAGYGKLLATGTPTAKLTVTVAKATEKAIAKIEAAGGSVTVTAAADETDEASDDAE